MTTPSEQTSPDTAKTSALFIEETDGERGFTHREFWRKSGGFWSGERRRVAWFFTVAIALLILANIGIQYGINRWNKYFFDALEAKDTATAKTAVMLFLALAATAIVAMVTQVYCRMSIQANWRRWMTSMLMGEWLEGRRFYQLSIAG